MELHETDGSLPSGAKPGWRGFTLPMGVLSLPSNDVGSIAARLGQDAQAADEYVLVSDELGAPSLTLVGLVTGRPREVAHAR